MNPYLLETEMPRRLVELRREMERSHRLVGLLGRRFRSPGRGTPLELRGGGGGQAGTCLSGGRFDG
jgi:hypothetical protein